MILSEIIKSTTTLLEQVNISTARLDCLILLEDSIRKDRSWLLAHPEHELTDGQVSIIRKQIARRVKHEPLAYIRGKSEFYGREFLVNSHTLEPRPETETMVEQLLMLVDGGEWRVNSKNRNGKRQMTNEKLTIVDVGTGSGCIGITAKLELPKAQVVAIDIDDKCILTAKQNAKKLQADISFLQGNLVEPLLENTNWKIQIQQNSTVLLCNLPYVPAKYELNSAAKYEPKHAIFGGEDGLDLYRELFDQIEIRWPAEHTANKPQYILTESLPFQHTVLAKIAKNAGYALTGFEDFIQVFKLA